MGLGLVRARSINTCRLICIVLHWWNQNKVCHTSSTRPASDTWLDKKLYCFSHDLMFTCLKYLHHPKSTVFQNLPTEQNQKRVQTAFERNGEHNKLYLKSCPPIPAFKANNVFAVWTCLLNHYFSSCENFMSHIPSIVTMWCSYYVVHRLKYWEKYGQVSNINMI